MLKRRYFTEQNKNKKKHLILKILFALLFLVILIYFIFVKPAILSLLDYHGKIYVTNALTQAVNKVLNSENINYDDLVLISKNSDGSIASVKTSGQNINLLKNTIIKEITSMLFGDKSIDIKIPIGTLIGGELFNGKGPEISIKISATGYANADIISVFEEAGINQTNHILKLRIKMDYTTVIPVYSKANVIESDYLIAQMLIVGKIPQYYSRNSNDPGYFINKTS